VNKVQALFLPAVIADDHADDFNDPAGIAGACGVISLSLDDARITVGRDARLAIVTALITALREG
jgi:hypothetical protein